jgi:hypothetical protein
MGFAFKGEDDHVHDLDAAIDNDVGGGGGGGRIDDGTLFRVPIFPRGAMTLVSFLFDSFRRTSSVPSCTTASESTLE